MNRAPQEVGDTEDGPAVVVIVPARDEERFLRPCLRSIREQWFRSWECVIVDDGSVDGTAEIAAEFVEKDPRFRLVSHLESAGLAAARNSGISNSSAPYLTFLDADDFLYPDSLKSRLESIQAHRSRFVAGVYCDWQPTRERQGRTPPERRAAERPDIVGFIDGPECPFIATAPLVRREVIEELGGFDERLVTAEDFDLWIRIMRAGYTFAYVPIVGVAYRQKASGMVFTGAALHAKVSSEIIMAQYEDLSEMDDPPLFSLPLSDYARDVVLSKRLLRSYAIAAVFGDNEGQDQIAEMFPASIALLARAGLDVSAELRAGVARCARAVRSLNEPEARKQLVESLITELGLSSSS